MSASLPIESIRIWPGVAVARVGDSSEFYFASELPGLPPGAKPISDPDAERTPSRGQFDFVYVGDKQSRFFRDSSGKLKREAARFRVYGYGADGKVLAELTPGTDVGNGFKVESVKWTVHMCNAKV